ncbi:type II secretion system protein GspD [Chromobacterium sp. IIBBL 290-4]|uniref:type II secretion system protein GspD n=1 Tax=Chromobacterium sp. IIBBL 290-4 TaxID=2953890 RepID=UPI0020B8F726|nr:secretin N-terminal domain-containing protein [Chromobacterium sp. IIBBL 290-4]UTH73580.1 hypothetical protein NKT35_18865 [Chromobacterium sp. IIBBL 290-4]
MKLAGWLCLLLLSPLAMAAQVTMTFDQIRIADFVKLYYTEVAKRSFVLDAKAQASDASITASLSGLPASQQAVVFRDVMRAAGFMIESKGSIDYIHLLSDQPQAVADQVWIYRPHYRDANYLTDMIAGLFTTGRFVQNRPVQRGDAPHAANDQGNSPLSTQSRPTDALVFQGTAEEVKRLQSLIDQLDKPVQQVRLRAVVYEVTGSDKGGFNLAAVIRAAGQRLSLSAGVVPQSAAPASTAFKFSGASIDLFAELFATDSRFNVVTRPDVLASDGESTLFQSGENVPVLGAVTYDAKGNPVQSVDYKPSGVLIEVRPTVRDKVIRLDLIQEVSTFVETKTGVNSSPTLMTRNLKSSFSVKPGDVYVLGGLKTSREGRDRAFFPFTNWKLSDSTYKTDTEIVILVQCDIATENS